MAENMRGLNQINPWWEELGDWEHAPINEMMLTARPDLALRNANILTVGRLLSLSDEAILSIGNLGKKSLAEIRHKTRFIITQGWAAFRKVRDEKKWSGCKITGKRYPWHYDYLDVPPEKRAARG